VPRETPEERKNGRTDGRTDGRTMWRGWLDDDGGVLGRVESRWNGERPSDRERTGLQPEREGGRGDTSPPRPRIKKRVASPVANVSRSRVSAVACSLLIRARCCAISGTLTRVRASHVECASEDADRYECLKRENASFHGYDARAIDQINATQQIRTRGARSLMCNDVTSNVDSSLWQHVGNTCTSLNSHHTYTRKVPNIKL